MTSVRWGLLSTARINRRLIPAIRASRQGKVAAIASRDLEKARGYAEKWNIPHAFGSYQEMLDSGEVDTVYISLPNHLHAKWTVKALESGIHVLCEKPFAISLEEVDAVIAARDKSGAVVAEALMYRHHPQARVVREFFQSGKLGEIAAMRGIFTFTLREDGRSPDSLDVRMVPEFGGGSLWDVGIYPLSYFQCLLGTPPRWVSGSQISGPTGVDEVFNGQMGYRTPTGKEVLAQLTSSFNVPNHTALEIIGRDGRLTATRPFNNIDHRAELIFTDRKGRSRKLNIPQKPLYLGEVEDLQAAILDGEKPLISLKETRNHILTVLALYRSARTGQFVNLEDFSRL